MVMSRPVLFVASLAAAALILLGTSTAGAVDYSGTVVGVDRGAGTIVIGEVGPWRVEGGKTAITRRTLVVGPGTRFAVSRRVGDPGPGGWPGGFVETTLAPWAVKAGDFVTVRVEDGQRPTATQIVVTVTEGG